MTVPIQPSTRQDLPAIVRLLAESLEGDPIYLDILPARPDRRRALEHFYVAYLRALGARRGVVDLARDAEGALVGVAVWERSPVGNDSAFLPQLANTHLFLRALGLRGMFPAKHLQEVLEAHRPVDAHWYLPVVAVRPEARRGGVATALLRHRLDELDEQGLAAYLESGTVDDRRFFERMGFIPGAVIQGLPASRPVGMFRAPARRRAR